MGHSSCWRDSTFWRAMRESNSRFKVRSLVYYSLYESPILVVQVRLKLTIGTVWRCCISRYATEPNLVDRGRIELPTVPCKDTVFPIIPTAQIFNVVPGRNLQVSFSGWERITLTPTHYSQWIHYIKNDWLLISLYAISQGEIYWSRWQESNLRYMLPKHGWYHFTTPR